MKHAINWFEIPVRNLEKAKKFYETVMGGKMEVTEAMGMRSAFFDADLQEGGIGGCLIEGNGYEPSSKGALVYLNGGDDLSTVLSKVEAAGGKILLPKTSIGEHGYMAHFSDPEGNRIGIHSAN